MSNLSDLQRRCYALGVTTKRFLEKLPCRWLVTLSSGKKVRLRARDVAEVMAKIRSNKMFPCLVDQLEGWKEDCDQFATNFAIDSSGDVNPRERVMAEMNL